MGNKVIYEDFRCPMGPESNGYKGFSIKTEVTRDRDVYVSTYILYYTNTGYDGKRFCCIRRDLFNEQKNGEITFGADWCYQYESEIKEMCGKLTSHESHSWNTVYNFDEQFKKILRDKALSKLIKYLKTINI